jgi:hypothetical protein
MHDLWVYVSVASSIQHPAFGIWNLGGWVRSIEESRLLAKLGDSTVSELENEVAPHPQ